MTQSVIIKRSGRIALLVLNNSPVNALSAPLRSALFDALNDAGQDPEVAGVVLIGDGRCFCAGADVSEFRGDKADKISSGRDPGELMTLIDGFDKPVVAALHGTALGGGLELALSCHYRVAARSAQLGLPEINLGVLPGAGGTQRLPRLIGLALALDMMLTGNAVDVDAALHMGLVDEVLDGELSAGAVRFVEAVIAGGKPLPRIREREIKIDQAVTDFFTQARAAVTKRRSSKEAALSIIACVEAVLLLPFDDGLTFERAQFDACNASPEAAALQYGFFARRSATKIAGISAATAIRRIEQIAVVGGGTMGRGIAMACAAAGYQVSLVETSADRAQAAYEAIAAECERMRSSGRVSAEQAATMQNLIETRHALAEVAACDLVIEAVFEDMALKTAISRELGSLCKPGAIIASNTSTLDVNVLAQASGRPQDFVGMHFFSPAHIMRLLEVVRGDATTPDVLASVLAVARKLGKDPVVSGVCYGFIGNRMLEPLLRETEALLLEGATPAQIDRAMESFGMAMGPCRTMDLAGVDVVAKVVIECGKLGALPDDPHYRIVCRELYELGRHGQKTALGFYQYEGRKAVEDAEITGIIEALAARHGIARRADISEQEIVERCLLPLINEGFRILEEGIAYRESDIDVVWLSGYGFPASRGGPMFHARAAGISYVRERLLSYGQLLGNAYNYWTPAATLSDAIVQPA